jgi:hypothetical protein
MEQEKFSTKPEANKKQKVEGEMFSERVRDERIGHLRKSNIIDDLKPVEKYFLEKTAELDVETAYDVIANESLNFKTIGYTDWGTNFLMYPLQYEIRRDCIFESQMSPEPVVDYVSYYKNLLAEKNTNKYKNRIEANREARDAVAILVGTNKLKEQVDIGKLQWIYDKHEGSVWFKPHPLTTHEFVGYIMDKIGKDCTLDRDEDMFPYIENSKKIYTTHYSESVIYAAILGKEFEPMDRYEQSERGGFSHVSNFLFKNQFNPQYGEIINRVFSCSRSGIINPRVDINWKEKIDLYLDYVLTIREQYVTWYRRQPAKKNIKV